MLRTTLMQAIFLLGEMASILPLFSLFLLLASSALASATALRFPKLSVLHKTWRSNSPIAQKILEESTAKGYQIFNYSQTLDHFDHTPESYATFRQRYAINHIYWGGAKTNSPIFLYNGNEAALDGDLQAVGTGFLLDNAAHFKALLVVVEHRYYGESYPFGSKKEAFRNASTLGYFSSSQALADYAEIATSLKKNLSADNCPVIAIGGSYGGMLASWFRLKYPHIAIGALASSAPILYFDDITPQNGYLSVVTKDFNETSESCYETIRESWSEINKMASQQNGLNLLSEKFNTCGPLNSSELLKDKLEDLYCEAAQYGIPWDSSVAMICNGIDGAPQGTDILARIFAGVEAFRGKQKCLPTLDNNNAGWDWQVCTEMVMPIGCGSNDTMFEASPFDIADFTKGCQETYGVTPRPHWITTEFGGHDIKSVLEKFGSNIIFSNGLRDPYSSGGVLYNISDSIVAIATPEGSHCLDLLPSEPDDPEWLVAQRNAEIEIVVGWIAEYNASIGAKTGTIVWTVGICMFIMSLQKD